MARPQEAELRRSGNVPALNPDATESIRQADRAVSPTEPRGPVPPEQRPGHHPETDQDKPDLDAFAAALGVRSDDETGGSWQRRPLWMSLMAAAAAVGFVYGVCRALRRRLH